MTTLERATQCFVWAIAGFTVIFLMTPLVVTIAVSFGSSTVFTLPPPDWSKTRRSGTRSEWPAERTSSKLFRRKCMCNRWSRFIGRQ